MRHMAFDDSQILQEFGRIMQEKDELKKIAQVVPSAAELYKNKLVQLQQKAQTPNPNHDPNLLIGQADLQKLMELGRVVGGDVAKQAMEPLQEWQAGRSPKPVLLKLQPHDPGAGIAPVTKPSLAPPMQKQQMLSIRDKIAEQKAYDVTPKEDMIQEAHPKPAKVCGDELVENKNEQQEADLEVARKSAQTKKILSLLYKFAKRLKTEKNEKAYALVKDAFLDISKSIKK